MSEVRFDASTNPCDARRQSPWWGIHVARYLFALPYVSGRRAMDVACGTGYGLPLLGSKARWVVGVDIDLDAARKAAHRIGNGLESVVVGDGCLLPFADASFEFITSFETLEHLENRPLFLAELRRVLAPGGLCIISTPNANYTRPVNGKPRNPHHVYEYAPEELLDELSAQFASVQLFGQALGPRFALSPFWDDQQRLPRTLKAQSRLLLWRALNKLPPALRDAASQAVWRHPLYPTEKDYEFKPEIGGGTPVLVAVCRPSNDTA